MIKILAEWSSLVARKSHDLEAAGSNPVSAIRQARDFPEKWITSSTCLPSAKETEVSTGNGGNFTWNIENYS